MTKAIQISQAAIANGVATLDANTILTPTQFPAVSGDVSVAAGSTTATLANSGVVAGTYNGISTQVTPFTVDAKGRITSAGTAVIVTPAWSSITSKPTTLAGYGIIDAQLSSDAVTKSATGLGQTGGGLGLDITTNTAAEWAALPVGYSRMFGSASQRGGDGTEGAPDINYGYFRKIANRDTGDGWVGMWYSYQQPGNIWYGATVTSAATATWYKVWTQANDGDGSGMDADLLDGQQGSFYMAASMSDVNNTAGKVVLRDTDQSVQVGDVKINALVTLKPYTITTTSIQETILATFSTGLYGCIKVVLSATTGTERHVTECLITYNSTDAFMTEYGTMWTGAAKQFNLSVDITTGGVRLKTTSTAATSTVYRFITTLLVP